MIRRGKIEGWLQIPSEALLPWAMLNEVSFDRTVPGLIEGKGAALLAKEDLNADDDEPRELLTVPRDLILSLERVREHAKVDRDFREVLEALGDFGRTPRGAILSFLLVQASNSCPYLARPVGVHSPFSEYIKSLPSEHLPTLWSPHERELLIGTTLAPAVAAKLSSLHREYDLLCSSAERTRWYQIVRDHLEFDDWLQVDAMYRSRALDFPDVGHCLVPCVDLANHASRGETIAIYEKNAGGDAVLLLVDEKQVQEGGEVTITYGDQKGACEMLFSYGFLDTNMGSAETLFLSLNLPEDDPLRKAKANAANCAPGFMVTDKVGDDIAWDGDFIWLLCVTDEDDLQFQLARTVEGPTETQAFFQSQELTGGAVQLHDLLSKTDLWDVYRLRAIAILQQRVFNQLQVLLNAEDQVENVASQDGCANAAATYETIMRLRQLEFALLEKAYGWFENQKLELVESPVVIRFLATMNQDPELPAGDLPDDFS